MTLQAKRILTSAFFSVTVISVVAFAGTLTLPNTFVAGATARAADVNANFTAVKTAVDDNDRRITALETMPAFAAPTFLTGWANVDTPYMTAGYLKDAIGFVHLRGLIKRTVPGAPGNIFTLPAGYRPSAVLQFPARCGDGSMCFIAVNPNGNVDFGGTGSPDTSLTLDGITFDPH